MTSPISQLRAYIQSIQTDDSKLFYNKKEFKEILSRNGITVPRTLMHITDLSSIHGIKDLKEFVMKPNFGSCGQAVYILTKMQDGRYREIDDRIHDFQFIFMKCQQLIEIRQAGGVLVEEVIKNPKDFNIFTSTGILDVRLYMLDDNILYGKVRIPSELSSGYSNTTRGAKALFVDKNGIVVRDDVFVNTETTYGNKNYAGYKLPYWKELSSTALKIASLFDLRYHSVDITINMDGKATCMESEAIPYLGNYEPIHAIELLRMMMKT